MSNFQRLLIIEHYLFAIKRRLLFSRKAKRQIIRFIRENIYNHIDEKGIIVSSRQDLYNQFGTVEQAAEKFLESRDDLEEKEYQKEHKRNNVLIILFSVLIIVIFSLMIWIRLSSKEIKANYITGELESSFQEEVL